MYTIEKKEVERQIKKLIEFRSTADRPRQLLATAKWLKREVRRMTRDHKLQSKIIVKNGVPTVLIMRNGTWKKPDTLLIGHFDVVDGKAADFQPRIKGDRIYGRGAADMKAGVVAMLHAFAAATRERPNASVALMITGDEETGGEKGTKHMVELGWKPKELICLDGGYGEEISHAEKGILRLVIKSKGKPGKVQHPWEGVSALDGIMDAVVALKELCPEEDKCTATDNWYSTYTPKSVITGPNGNEIMTRAELHASVHFVDEKTPNEMVNILRQKLPNLVIKNEIYVPRVYVDPRHPALRRFQNIYARHLRHKPRIRTENGSSDARFFSHLNIPMIITKPLSGNAEQDNEWVSLRSTVALTRALVDYLVETE